MIRLLPIGLEIALLVWCLIEIIVTPPEDTRNLPKWGWLAIVLFLPLIGCIAWLVAGRPRRVKQAKTWQYGAGFPEYERPAASTAAIDDQLERDLRRVDDEHEQMLRQWEQDLKRREAKRQEDEDPQGSGG